MTQLTKQEIEKIYENKLLAEFFDQCVVLAKMSVKGEILNPVLTRIGRCVLENVFPGRRSDFQLTPRMATDLQAFPVWMMAPQVASPHLVVYVCTEIERGKLQKNAVELFDEPRGVRPDGWLEALSSYGVNEYEDSDVEREINNVKRDNPNLFEIGEKGIGPIIGMVSRKLNGIDSAKIKKNVDKIFNVIDALKK